MLGGRIGASAADLIGRWAAAIWPACAESVADTRPADRARSAPSRSAVLVLTLMMVLALPLGVLAGDEEDTAGTGRQAGAGTERYIVTLALPDATSTVDISRAAGRTRALQRARRSQRAIDALERRHDFSADQRFGWAMAGFAAALTPSQRARLARDPDVVSIRPARTFEPAAQVVPANIRRVKAQPDGGPPAPDVDVDVAIVDTGIGPVGGGELNAAGGVNCSGDGKAEDKWRDFYSGRHGTHVAGIVGARDNDLGVVGVAPGARLWSLRVFDAFGYGDEGTIMCALDWAIATRGPEPPAGSQPIEVANMSLVGPRLPGDRVEECGVPDDPDTLHVAVCNAVAAGITVVVAAGNAASDARRYVPAAYDQVITVGAISDFDGAPGGSAAATCAASFYGSEKDDTYARYSNFGRDVDIVAPGSCVLSTYPSGDGRATQRLSGTSMAAPHVAGAAARYLADHPGTSPEAMRRLLRASGSLDWDAATDPDWRGASADTPPDRLLDVAALIAPTLDVVLWALPSRLRVAAGTAKAHVRVEVQRLGGHDVPVNLSVSGLPGAVGNGSFVPNATLTDKGTLGRRLRVDLETGAPDGRYTLALEADGGGAPATRDLRLKLDRTGPVLSGPRLRPLAGRSLRQGEGVATRVTWSASDELSRVRKTLLQRFSGGRWRTLATAGSKGATRIEVSSRTGTRLRLKGVDGMGNASTKTIRTEVRLVDAASGAVDAAGEWSAVRSSGAITGGILVSSRRGDTLEAEVSGRGVALVAPVGPSRGALRVRLDGGDWTRVSLKASSRKVRHVVFGRAIAGGVHRLELRVAAGSVAVDALLVLR